MWRCIMVKNDQPIDNRRHGVVRERSQTQTPSGHRVKRDAITGRFMSIKRNDFRFKAFGRSNKKALLEAF